ncbi:hypothetical protein [Halopelagius longus]|uniref:DUF7999 domain-containing protein n=1 Tax=Halopelagius longus TaxID=1236180 RepID=A0A1H1AAM4_9EURY|nr:hypothetical protein [Halopelagius longus]SDQ36697.1 hypothetical protein SAMN05216278_1245 [Halopelagius longus]
MSQNITPATGDVRAVRIVWPMNDHGAMTVRVESDSEVRQVVECESDEVRETLERLPAGTTLPLKMESVGMRGNAWRAVELVDDRRVTDTASSRTEYRAEQKYAPDGEASEQQETAQA